MDNVLKYIINLIVFVPITIILIIVSIRLSKSNLGKIGFNKYTKILEKTSLNKDTDVFVLKMGDEGCVLVASTSNIEKIKDLSKDQIEKIESSKLESKVKLKDNTTDSLTLGNLSLDSIKSKLKEKKDGKLS